MSFRHLITLSALVLMACARTPSNVYILSTTDCGVTWAQVPVGARVPVHTGDPCGFNAALPNWPMAGEATFKTQFAQKVMSEANISYTYAITEPIAFIQEARYLSRMGTSLEISAGEEGSRYEVAENLLIDKLLREATTEITRELDVVDTSPADVEDKVFEQTKETLENRGVTMSDLALVIRNDDQTRLAIDAATAMRVYTAAGFEELGGKVLVARAGAPHVVVGSEVKP